MTPIIDSTTVEQICTWLAEQPCPDPGCIKGLDKGSPSVFGSCRSCDGTGLAFPWASEECPPWFGEPGKPASWQEGGSHKGHDKCNGSGCVPKALGLEALLEMQYMVVIEALAGEFIASRPQDRPPDFLLAALRAVAKQAGMPDEPNH
jgi:hypothetical protein